MKKDDLFQLLRNSSIEEFNKERPYDESELIDLTELDFRGCELKDANLSNCDLTGSDFSAMYLKNVNFNGSDLTSIDFTGSTLKGCDFTNSILNGIKFNSVTIHKCEFEEADFSGADLSSADISSSDLSTTKNLTECIFDGSTIWPDEDMLPDGFETVYQADLSSLIDEEDDFASNLDY